MIKHHTLQDVLKFASLNDRKGIYFINNDNSEIFMPYKELYERALTILYNMQLRDLESGKELIFQIENTEKFIEVFWACILGGIIPVPIPVGNSDEDKEKIKNIWKKLKNPALVIDSINLASLKKYLYKQGLKDTFSEINDNILFLEKIEEKQGIGIESNISSESIAYIQFSSGSTGNPKGVILTHENILTNVNDIITGANVKTADSALSWMPLTHDTGLIAFHIGPLAANINQYIMPTLLFIMYPFLWLKKASDYKITILCSPNFGYKHFLNHFNPQMAENLELSPVRILMNGAEPINSELCDVFLDKMSTYGLKRNAMFPGYGLAEASVVVTLPIPEETHKTVYITRDSILTGQVVKETDNKEKGVSFVDVGYPVENCNLRICDDEDRILTENTIGHVQIKGKNVTKGYYNDIEETRRTFTNDGWLKTGDLGFIRNESLVVTGRAKDIIFVNGQNYYPQDIENIASNIAKLDLGMVVACGIFNTTSQKEDIFLFIMFDDNLDLFATLATLLKEKVSKKIEFPIRFVIPVKNIPKTASGKVQRYKLIEQYNKGEFHEIVEKLKELTAIDYVAPENETEEKLVLLWKEILEVDKIGTMDNFFELGGHSIEVTTLVSRIHKEFNVKVPLREIFEEPTIKEMSKYLENAPKSIYSSIKPVEEEE